MILRKNSVEEVFSIGVKIHSVALSHPHIDISHNFHNLHNLHKSYTIFPANHWNFCIKSINSLNEVFLWRWMMTWDEARKVKIHFSWKAGRRPNSTPSTIHYPLHFIQSITCMHNFTIKRQIQLQITTTTTTYIHT